MTYKSDEEIQGEVMFQLGWDSRIKQTEIGVTVRKGIVTLTGTVENYAKKLAAGERPIEGKKLRVLNEVPGVAAAIIVILVVARPF